MAATENENKAKPGTTAEGMGVAKGGWFTELSTMWPGQGLSLKVDEIVFQDRSKFQVHIPSDGRILVSAVRWATRLEQACASPYLLLH